MQIGLLAERRGLEGPPSDARAAVRCHFDRKRGGWRTRERAGQGVEENAPDLRPAAVTFATSEHYVIRLILRICLSKIRAGTRRRSMLTRPAPEPAVYRSFGFGSVAAATITLAITAGSFPVFIPSARMASK